MRLMRNVAALAVGVAAALAAPLAGAAQAAGPTCQGRPAEFVVVPVWFGSPGPDVVLASAAVVDQIWAGDGDDVICVYNPLPALDGVEVHAGAGDDSIETFSGHNEIYGDDGDDVVVLAGSGEFVQAGDGNDRVWGKQAGPMFASGGAGTDLLQGGWDQDVLVGGDGNDVLYGLDEDDILQGGNGIDRLFGGDGDDELWGQADPDRCVDALGTTFLDCEVIEIA